MLCPVCSLAPVRWTCPPQAGATGPAYCSRSRLATRTPGRQDYAPGLCSFESRAIRARDGRVLVEVRDEQHRLRPAGAPPVVGNVAQPAGGSFGLSMEPVPPDDGRTRAGPRGCWDIPQTIRWSQAQKWGSLDPGFARKLLSVWTHMQSKGWKPPFIGGGYRPWSAQQCFVQSKASKATFSYHNVVRDDLVPAARAVDLEPGDRGLSSEQKDRWFRDLREGADKAGLGSGGWFGLSPATRAQGWSAPLSWDPSHVEDPRESLYKLERTIRNYYLSRGIDPLTGDPVGETHQRIARADAQLAKVQALNPIPLPQSHSGIMGLAGAITMGIASGVFFARLRRR